MSISAPVAERFGFHLAVLGTVGGGLASSAHEWLLQRLAAVITLRGIAAVGPWHLVSLGTLALAKLQALGTKEFRECRAKKNGLHAPHKIRGRDHDGSEIVLHT